jgi:hypothetical protein
MVARAEPKPRSVFHELKARAQHLPEELRKLAAHMARYRYSQAYLSMKHHFPVTMLQRWGGDEALVDQWGNALWVLPKESDWREPKEDELDSWVIEKRWRFFTGDPSEEDSTQGFRNLRAYLRGRGIITDAMHRIGGEDYGRRHPDEPRSYPDDDVDAAAL